MPILSIPPTGIVVWIFPSVELAMLPASRLSPTTALTRAKSRMELALRALPNTTPFDLITVWRTPIGRTTATLALRFILPTTF